MNFKYPDKGSLNETNLYVCLRLVFATSRRWTCAFCSIAERMDKKIYLKCFIIKSKKDRPLCLHTLVLVCSAWLEGGCVLRLVDFDF